MGLSGTIWEYLGLSRTRVQVEAGESMLLLFETFSLVYFFLHKRFLEELALLKNSIFKDIIQNEVDPPTSHPIFDKFIFDTVFIMLTSLPPIEFLTKIMKF